MRDRYREKIPRRMIFRPDRLRVSRLAVIFEWTDIETRKWTAGRSICERPKTTDGVQRAEICAAIVNVEYEAFQVADAGVIAVGDYRRLPRCTYR